MQTAIKFSLFTLTLIAGCGGSHNAKLRQDVHYRHPEYPYALHAHGALESPMVMLSADWKPDTLRLGSQTFDGYESRRPIKVKQHYDWNEDGVPDYSEEVPQYDVRLVHGTGATVSIRAVPVPLELYDLSLGELTSAYLEEATHDGSGEAGAVFHPRDLINASETQFELKVLDEARCRVSGIEAYRIEIVGHRTVPDASSERRTRLVVVRPGYKHRVEGAEGREVPVMLVAAYTHTPEQFEELEDDFNRFLNSWVLGGYGAAIPTERLGHTCQP